MASRKTLNLENLQTLGAARLAEILIERATGNATIKWRRLELSTEAGVEAVAAAIGKRLATTELDEGRTVLDVWPGPQVLERF